MYVCMYADVFLVEEMVELCARHVKDTNIWSALSTYESNSECGVLYIYCLIFILVYWVLCFELLLFLLIILLCIIIIIIIMRCYGSVTLLRINNLESACEKW